MLKHQLFWRVTQLSFCRVAKLRYRYYLEEGSDPEPAPPYIVVANHGNIFDPWMIGLYFRKALHIMTNDDGFRSSALTRWYLRGIGAFAKKKGAHDLRAMKSTLSFLRNKEPVLIFPEGQATWDGETQPIYGGIERMVKRARVPLVIIHFRGNFLSHPWWAETDRKGRVVLERTVIPAEQLGSMDEHEILTMIRQGIYNNDILCQENRGVDFHGKHLAEGLERLVWICMRCQAEDALATAGNTIRCKTCGGSWDIDAHCRLRAQVDGDTCYDDLYAWVQEHKRTARRKVAAATAETELARNHSVSLLKENDRGQFTPETSGTLRLTKTEFTYEPDSGAIPPLRFAVSELQNYVIQKKDIFEVTHEDVDYRLEMKGSSPMKWLMYLRYLRGFEEAERRGVI